MKKYYRIYKAFIKANFSELFAYRANLFNNLLASFLWGSVSITLILFLTARTPRIFGWSREEVLLLTGIANIFVSIFYFLFSRNFDRFSQVIHKGQLDSILLKPVDSQFLMSATYVNFSGAGRIIVGIGFTIYVLNRMNYTPTVGNMLFALGLLISGMVIVYSFWYITSTLIIWWTNLSNLSGLLYEFNSLTRFPQQMYRAAGFVLFYLIFPLTLVITTPARVLIGKAELGNVLWLLLFSVVFFSISRFFWKFALRFYTSASG